MQICLNPAGGLELNIHVFRFLLAFCAQNGRKRELFPQGAGKAETFNQGKQALIWTRREERSVDKLRKRPSNNGQIKGWKP